MDLEEDEQEPAQELIAADPEGNNEDPPPATDAVPRQINQDFNDVVQEMAEPVEERGEMQPGDYKTERPARNRRPPSTLNYATLGHPYESSPSTTVCHPTLPFYPPLSVIPPILFPQILFIRLHSTVPHHHFLQHYLFLQPILIYYHSLQPHLHFGLLRDIITQAMVTQCCLQAKYSYKSFYYVVLLNGQNNRRTKKNKRT